jgi:hypothetical protein
VSGDFHVAAPRDAATVEIAPREDAPDAPAPAEDDRMDILRALERGEITVAEATDRLSKLDEVLR